MDFLNQQIDIDNLPDAAAVEWRKIERNYLKVLRIQWLILSLLLFSAAAIVVFFSRTMQQPVRLLIITSSVIFISVFYFIYLYKSFIYRRYALREHDILYRHGWLIRSTDACPFNRVQHCSVNAGPLERNYKLASLTLFTAASGEADIKISGLPVSTAFEIREYVMKKIAPYDGNGT
jgi:membrane protein YdbS with pleckstrin-like domain